MTAIKPESRYGFLDIENNVVKFFNEYLIGSSNAKPLRDFILEMQEELDPNAKPLFGEVPFTGTNLALESFSTKDTENDCGFKAKVSFAEGTRRTMEWLKEVDKGE